MVVRNIKFTRGQQGGVMQTLKEISAFLALIACTFHLISCIIIGAYYAAWGWGIALFFGIGFYLQWIYKEE